MLVNIPANVGGLEHQFYFPRNIGKLIIPIDELHHFSEGWLNHQAVSDNPTWWFSSFPLRSTMIWGVSLGRPRRALRSQVRARWDISCERIMQVICETHVWRGYWVGKIFYLWIFLKWRPKQIEILVWGLKGTSHSGKYGWLSHNKSNRSQKYDNSPVSSQRDRQSSRLEPKICCLGHPWNIWREDLQHQIRKYRRRPKLGVPQNGWFRWKTLYLKWMI